VQLDREAGGAGGQGGPVARLVVASLNTRGIPVPGSRLAARYAVIGAGFEASDADVVCVQEVFSYWHLRMLARRMPSFRHVSYRRSAAGPAGGLVTFSRGPAASARYAGFGVPPRAAGLSRLARWRAGFKGALVTRLAEPGLTVVNVHPVPNHDGDWSAGSRFYPWHQAQLAALAEVVRGAPGPVVACGDFNVSRDSPLFAGFTADTGLSDVFGGGCPATFRAEYLPAGKAPHCIDFILAGAGVQADAAMVLFADRAELPGGPGFVSDHLGLSARLRVDPAGS
jgi:endonuclease/exonuclease/phosphatase (EEP) superfamily protein YafD